MDRCDNQQTLEVAPMVIMELVWMSFTHFIKNKELIEYKSQHINFYQFETFAELYMITAEI